MHHAHIDKFAYQKSPAHKLDARIKFIAAIVYSIIVISLPKTSISIIVFCGIGPFAMLTIAGVPLKFILKQIIVVSPFILALALTSIFYDRTPISKSFGPLEINTTEGILRCINIMLKFIVTLTTLMALICTTKFSLLLEGIEKLGMPKILVIQLGLLYRYIFVLIDKVQHILRARAIRKLRNLGFKKELHVAGSMLGTLFVSSLETSARVNTAMEARGFNGQFYSIWKLKISALDYIFSAIFILYSAAILMLNSVIK